MRAAFDWMRGLIESEFWYVLDEFVDPLISLLTLGLVLWAVGMAIRILRRKDDA